MTFDKAKNLRMNNNDFDIMNRINQLNNKNVNNKMKKKRRKLLAQIQYCRALQACIKQACPQKWPSPENGPVNGFSLSIL